LITESYLRSLVWTIYLLKTSAFFNSSVGSNKFSKQGADSKENEALACRSCNLRKGNRISSKDSESNTEVRLFHPR